jgi:5'-nucleotidase
MSRRLVTLATIATLVVVAACNSSGGAATSTTTDAAPAAAPKPLRVLVTNDDGVKADGIDTLVNALKKVPNTKVIVVAPLKNQSATGGKTTPGGKFKVTTSKTKSGYPARAVAGYPADTIVWAIDKHGLATPPDVVLSGINFGQNLGRFVDASGTVGAARAAAKRGVPALAVSADIRNPDYAASATEALSWLKKHRAGIRTAKPTVTNLNIPTCATGERRALIKVPLAGSDDNLNAGKAADCVTVVPTPTNDVQGFIHGYVVQTDKVPIKPAK